MATFAAEVVARIASDADLWDVAEEMVQADVGALAVDTGDGVSGIVSERDLVRALAARQGPVDDQGARHREHPAGVVRR